MNKIDALRRMLACGAYRLRTIFLFVMLCVSSATTAAPTTLDSTFGTGGKLTYSVASGIDIPYASALQPDGKIIIGGYCYTTLYAICISRVNANGTLDSSFGASGTYVAAVGTTTTTNAGVAVLPDGKIVFGGQCAVSGQIDFCMLPLTASGALDSTFGASGVTTTNFGGTSDDLIFGISAVADGTVIAAGRCNGGSGYRFCMARYLGNGSLDQSFGAGGTGLVMQSLTPTGESRGRAAAIQTDGKLLLSGNCDYSGVVEFCMARFSANGMLDSTFGSAGIAHTSLSGGTDFGIVICSPHSVPMIFPKDPSILENDGHEKEQIHGRTDHRVSASG